MTVYFVLDSPGFLVKGSNYGFLGKTYSLKKMLVAAAAFPVQHSPTGVATRHT